MLQIQTRKVPPDVVVLEVTGRITIGRDCQQLEWSTDELVSENNKSVVFDLSGVSHIDSTGVGIIVMSTAKIKQAGGKLHVCAQGHVEQVLHLTSVDKVVDLYPSMGAAVAGF